MWDLRHSGHDAYASTEIMTRTPPDDRPLRKTWSDSALVRVPEELTVLWPEWRKLHRRGDAVNTGQSENVRITLRPSAYSHHPAQLQTRRPALHPLGHPHSYSCPLLVRRIGNLGDDGGLVDRMERIFLRPNCVSTQRSVTHSLLSSTNYIKNIDPPLTVTSHDGHFTRYVPNRRYCNAYACLN